MSDTVRWQGIRDISESVRRGSLLGSIEPVSPMTEGRKLSHAQEKEFTRRYGGNVYLS